MAGGVWNRVMTACQLFPSIAPHGPHVPTSIWRLDWSTWVGVATVVEDHRDAVAAQQK